MQDVQPTVPVIVCDVVPDPGGADQTAAINDWLAALPRNVEASFGGQTYYCETKIVIQGRDNLAITNGVFKRKDPGHGGVFNSQNRNPHILIEDCTDIAVRDIRIEGSNTYRSPAPSANWPKWYPRVVTNGVEAPENGYEFEAGIRVRFSDGVVIENCRTKNTWGDGIHFEGGSNYTAARNVIEWAGRQGIVGNATNVVIDNNIIRWTYWSAVDVEPIPESPIGKVVVSNNECHSRVLPFAGTGWGPGSELAWLNNTITSTLMPLLVVADNYGKHRRSKITVRGNKFLGPLGTGYSATQFWSCDDITVEENILGLDPTRQFSIAYLNDCGGNIVIRNNVVPTGPPGQRVNILNENPRQDQELWAEEYTFKSQMRIPQADREKKP